MGVVLLATGDGSRFLRGATGERGRRDVCKRDLPGSLTPHSVVGCTETHGDSFSARAQVRGIHPRHVFRMAKW